MSALRKFGSLPKWVQAVIVVTTVGALVIATLLVVSGDEQVRQAAQPREDGMADMPGMDMSGSADGSIVLTAAQLREFGVTFGTVEQRLLSERVRAAGVVTFDETRVTALAPKFSGTAERVYAGFTGAPVRAGQAMLEVYSPDLVAAQEEMLVAARMSRATGGDADLVAAAKLRLRLLDISEAQIEQVLRSATARRTLTLHARAGGVVVEKNIVAGEAFQANQTLFRIADLSTVWIDAELREADAAMARVGSSAEVELPALPGRTVVGRVDYVYPTLEEQTRTVRARVRVAKPGMALKPGMYATVRIEVPTRTALTVPASALVRTGERDIVFVEMGGGRIMPQDVVVGRIGDEYAEIISGVEPGQRVVTSAQFLIDSESNLAEVMKSMIGQMNTGDMRDMPGMEGMDMNERGADTRGMKMPAPRR
jgi:Cu(I)/Ag(I) efflux system membrane fusion protein